MSFACLVFGIMLAVAGIRMIVRPRAPHYHYGLGEPRTLTGRRVVHRKVGE